MTYLLYIDRHTYLIPPEGFADVQTHILDAVHAGGAFVAVPHISGQSAHVLITPASRVCIRKTASAAATTPTDDDTILDLAFLKLDA